MTKISKKENRRHNGRTRAELLKFSKNGTVSTKHDGNGFLSRGFALANEYCVFFPDCIDLLVAVGSAYTDAVADLNNRPRPDAVAYVGLNQQRL